jgi:hypothetical protein
MISEDEAAARAAAYHRVRSQNASAFAKAADRGDVEEFARLADPHNDDVNIDWNSAFREVAKLTSVPPEISAIFVRAWIEHQGWPVHDRRTLVDALRVLMPQQPRQEGNLTLYRGTNLDEHTSCTYGFSWTTDPEIAQQKFAAGWTEGAQQLGNAVLTGVVLQTSAPPEAILLVRDPSPGDYDEAEVVVDPFLLGAVSVIERG